MPPPPSRPIAEQPAAIPSWQPAARQPAPISLDDDDDEEVGVELVTTLPPAPLPPPPPPEIVYVPVAADRALWDLNRRDLIMLVGGGAGVIGALVVGFGLSKFLRSGKSTSTEEGDEKKE
jgi:hypothetical protein